MKNDLIEVVSLAPLVAIKKWNKEANFVAVLVDEMFQIKQSYLQFCIIGMLMMEK